jgi:hypothetical protein
VSAGCFGQIWEIDRTGWRRRGGSRINFIIIRSSRKVQFLGTREEMFIFIVYFWEI